MLTGSAGLFRLVYRSRSALDGSDRQVQAALDGIVDGSQLRNAEAQITGALMHTHCFFVQALEGPTAAVEAAFDRICCDLRHREIEVVECSPILKRGFGDWSMRHLVPDAWAGVQLDCADDPQRLSDAAIRAMKLMVALTRPTPLNLGAVRGRTA